METKQAEFRTDIAHLKSDMNTEFARLKTDVAQWHADFGSQFAVLEKVIARSQKENADRSFRQLLATAGFVAGAVAVLGFLIRI